MRLIFFGPAPTNCLRTGKINYSFPMQIYLKVIGVNYRDLTVKQHK